MSNSQQSREPDIMDLEMLTPGSVWVRENGKQSRYLFTTNMNLPTRMLETYPQMVVYADEDDNILSVPVEDFIGKRTFYNVDPGLESRLGNLLAFNTEDVSETFDLDSDDSLLIEDSASTEVSPESPDYPQQVMAAVEETLVDQQYNMFPVSYFSGATGLPAVIAPEVLAELTESYQQQPLLIENKLLHILYIRVDKSRGITHDNLYACFSPTRVEQNAVYTFKVQTPDGVLDIDWDALIGIYPYVFQNISMFQVIFSTGVELTYEVADEPEVQFQVSTDPETGTNVISAVPTPEPGWEVPEVVDAAPVHAVQQDAPQVVQVVQADTTLAVSAG